MSKQLRTLLFAGIGIVALGAILAVLAVYKEKFIYMLDRKNWFKTHGASPLNLAIAMFPASWLGSWRMILSRAICLGRLPLLSD